MAPSLTSLPAEVRSMIYLHLFPHFYRPAKPLNILIYRSRRTIDLRSELSAVRSLMLTSRFFRREVVPIPYASIIPNMMMIDDFSSYWRMLTPYVRQQIHRIAVPMANSRTSERRQLVEGSKQMTVLQELIMHSCAIIKDSKYGGVKWKAYILQNIKAVKKACPHLKYASYHLENESIRLASTDSIPPDFVIFNVDEESAKPEARAREDSVPRTQQDITHMMNEALVGRVRGLFRAETAHRYLNAM